MQDQSSESQYDEEKKTTTLSTHIQPTPIETQQQSIPLLQTQTDYPLATEEEHQDGLLPYESLSAPLGTDSAYMECTKCNRFTQTDTKRSARPLAYVAAVLLSIPFFICCGCIYPFCRQDCFMIKHHCKHCNSFMGQYVPPLKLTKF